MIFKTYRNVGIDYPMDRAKLCPNCHGRMIMCKRIHSGLGVSYCIVHPGWYDCPSWGTVAEGSTPEEAIENWNGNRGSRVMFESRKAAERWLHELTVRAMDEDGRRFTDAEVETWRTACSTIPERGRKHTPGGYVTKCNKM